MSEYYYINNTNEKDVVGYYPQTTLTDDSWICCGVLSDKRILHERFAEGTPELVFKMASKAKYTDLLAKDPLYFGLIVSERMKHILDEYNLPNHRYYSVLAQQGKKTKQYYWLHMVFELFDYIDLDKSELEIFHKFNGTSIEIFPI